MKSFLYLLLSATVALAADRKPNVVLILIDDFGFECVAADGGESYKTPVMDGLAATGVRFENCHVQPLCTPTRVQLMTGLSNRRNYTHFGHLDPSQITFGNMLQANGYATCITGKWQLSNGLEGPAHFGFDEYSLWQVTRRPGRYKNPGLEVNGQLYDYKDNEYGPDLVSNYALDFVQRSKDKPFFLYYPMMLTHAPYDATPDSPDYLEAATGKAKGKGNSGHFADMVPYADKLIGKLVAKLDELGIRENTMLLILGDNGTGRGTPSKFRGRDVLGGKGTTTTWGTHVPAIFNWPGHWASGKVCNDLIDSTDFLPTICAATDTKVTVEKIDGRSFLPQLRGEPGQPRDWLYSWYNPSGGANAKAEFAHDAQFKLYTDGRFYDTSKDDLESSALGDDSLDDAAKAARVKLQAALKKYEGPRPAEFVAKTQRFGGESGEDAEGNKVMKPAKKQSNAGVDPAAKRSDPQTERFDQRDLDHDGRLSLEEFVKTASDKGNANERFGKFDVNKDGFVTRDEFLSPSKK